MEELSKEYRVSDRYRWLQAVQEVSEQLREDVLLLLQTSRDQCDSGVLLPRWHCAVNGCCASSLNGKEDVNHERGLGQHIWTEHRMFLTQTTTKRNQHRSFVLLEDLCFTLYSASLIEKERGFLPPAGLSVDRRSLNHVGEVCSDDQINIQICFISSCKHLFAQGFNKVGVRQEQKGKFQNKRDVSQLRNI